MSTQAELISAFMNLVYRIEPDFQERYNSHYFQYQKNTQDLNQILTIFNQFDSTRKVSARKFWNAAIQNQFNLTIFERYKWEEEKDRPNGL